MKNLSKILGLFALVALTGLGACKDDDSDKCQNGTFELTINGDATTGKNFNNTLVIGNSAGTDGKRMDIRATDTQGRTLIITLTDNSSGASGNGVSTDEYIPISEVTTGTENVFLFTIIENDMSYPFIEGTLDITSCDANAKQVSGTFSFADGDFEVTNGSFTNMCYRIVK